MAAGLSANTNKKAPTSQVIYVHDIYILFYVLSGNFGRWWMLYVIHMNQLGNWLSRWVVSSNNQKKKERKSGVIESILQNTSLSHDLIHWYTWLLFYFKQKSSLNSWLAVLQQSFVTLFLCQSTLLKLALTSSNLLHVSTTSSVAKTLLGTHSCKYVCTSVRSLSLL